MASKRPKPMPPFGRMCPKRPKPMPSGRRMHPKRPNPMPACRLIGPKRSNFDNSGSIWGSIFVIFRCNNVRAIRLSMRSAEPLFLPTGAVLQRVRRLCETTGNRKKTTKISQNRRSRANLTSKLLRNRRSRANLTAKGRRNRRSRANWASKAALGDLPCP